MNVKHQSCIPFVTKYIVIASGGRKEVKGHREGYSMEETRIAEVGNV